MANKTLTEAFGLLQKIGKSLMLPVSVLPIAGILLGVGSAHFGWMPSGVSDVMAQSGGAIFGSLPLLFAIAVAVGLAENDGVAAMAATVGFVVLLGTMGVMARIFGMEAKEVMGIKAIDTGVFGGILIGGISAFLFRRYYRIQLPPYLGFFAGKRFVPIVTAIAAIGLGIVLSVVWPPIQAGIDKLSHFAAYGNPTLAATMYGVIERLLVPFGLHHIWNVPFFFEIGSFTDSAGKVVHGDINRFFAGDPSAGILGGAYLFKMWGLPAAALAIWQTSKPDQKAKVGSIMISAALTSFLTGITEPIEFSFLFVAPLLYLVHALMAGVCQLLFGLLGAKLGFTFSQGFIDYILYFPLDTRAWLVLVFGPIFAGIYFVVFRSLILTLNLRTPGREAEELEGSDAFQSAAPGLGKAVALVRALGGRRNIKSLDSCITRLRIELHDIAMLNTERLKALGASGVLMVGNVVQAIFGPLSENLKSDIEEALRKNIEALDQADLPPGYTPPDRSKAAPANGAQGNGRDAAVAAEQLAHARAWLEAMGGARNLVSVTPCAETRLRVVVRDPNRFDPAELRKSGVQAVMPVAGGRSFHLIVGLAAAGYAEALTEAMEA